MVFEKYQHVERWNHQECDGLLDGICYVFPKLDGTNASVWATQNQFDVTLHFGSRNRELSLDNDNAGFMNAMHKDKRLIEFFQGWSDVRLYGEWLVPHSLKTYRDDAWKKFYVFDFLRDGVVRDYETYKDILSDYDIDVIPPIAVIKNPTPEDLLKLHDKNVYLIQEGKGIGEGLVVKNYEFVNKYGRQVWGKMVTNEFKFLNHQTMGAPLINGSLLVEEQIVENFCTEAFIEKEKAKIIISHSKYPDALVDFNNKMIPELLGRVWYEFLKEETTEFVKKYKNPKINFGLLQGLIFKKVKRVIGLS